MSDTLPSREWANPPLTLEAIREMVDTRDLLDAFCRSYFAVYGFDDEELDARLRGLMGAELERVFDEAIGRQDVV